MTSATRPSAIVSHPSVKEIRADDCQPPVSRLLLILHSRRSPGTRFQRYVYRHALHWPPRRQLSHLEGLATFTTIRTYGPGNSHRRGVPRPGLLAATFAARFASFSPRCRNSSSAGAAPAATRFGVSSALLAPWILRLEHWVGFAPTLVCLEDRRLTSRLPVQEGRRGFARRNPNVVSRSIRPKIVS